MKESITPKNTLADLKPLTEAIINLSAPQEQKNNLLYLIRQLSTALSVACSPPSTRQNGGNSTDTRMNRANGASYSDTDMSRVPTFIPNKLLDINALCNAFLTGVKAFASPEEFTNAISAVEDFKRPGSIGRLLYDRAAARAADLNVENWEWELQLQRGFLDRRVALTSFTSFWTGHPFSQRPHSQAERAALLTYTTNNFKRKMEAGLVEPVVMNQLELTTAFHPWIFNTVRVPGIPSDNMQKHPNNDYCVVFWQGRSFKLSLSVGSRPATYLELHAPFALVLSLSVARSFVSIFTSDNRPS